MPAAMLFVPNWLLRIVLVLWLALIVAGLHVLNVHLIRPSSVPVASDDAPRDLAQASEPGLLRLVMLVNPRCVCTRASLDELEHLLRKSGRSVQVDLLIYRPPHATGDLWSIRRLTAAHPGLQRPRIRFIDDAGGTVAKRLGLVVSGHAMAFDSHGTLRSSGGLTAVRGHAGAGNGIDSIKLLIDGSRPRSIVAPVFGCPIAEFAEPSPSAATRKSAHAVFARRP